MIQKTERTERDRKNKGRKGEEDKVVEGEVHKGRDMEGHLREWSKK